MLPKTPRPAASAPSHQVLSPLPPPVDLMRIAYHPNCSFPSHDVRGGGNRLSRQCPPNPGDYPVPSQSAYCGLYSSVSPGSPKNTTVCAHQMLLQRVQTLLSIFGPQVQRRRVERVLLPSGSSPVCRPVPHPAPPYRSRRYPHRSGQSHSQGYRCNRLPLEPRAV